jgi:hypothetical protein
MSGRRIGVLDEDTIRPDAPQLIFHFDGELQSDPGQGQALVEGRMHVIKGASGVDSTVTWRTSRPPLEKAKRA